MLSATRRRTEQHFESVSRYRLPNLFTSDDDRRRLTHDDLPDMTNRELFAEETLAGFALAYAVGHRDACPTVPTSTGPCYSLPADEWLTERVRAVRAEVARRRSR